MRRVIFLGPLLVLVATPALAQLGLPGVNLPPATSIPGQVLGPLGDTVQSLDGQVSETADSLLKARTQRLARFLRHNRRYAEADANGAPARRGELLLMQYTPANLDMLRTQGFVLMGEENLPGLGLEVARIGIPKGTSLAEAQQRVGTMLPQASVSADNLYFQSGRAASSASGNAPGRGTPIATPVGMIDGAPSRRLGQITVRGFAQGAPHPDDHGSEVAGLLRGAGVADIRVADVYGTDPAGGNALAIVRGLAWLVQEGSKVISISLVGPPNPLLNSAIAAAQHKGVVLVAAVGNDGPAAPPAYPASYPGVLAVTAVDGHRHALIEDGRALHLDYAAPGADMTGTNAAGRRVSLRGTSYATPLVAARAAAALQHSANWRETLDREAVDLGAPGPDPVFGRGLLCGACPEK